MNMSKGTIGFGFRSPLEYTCLTSNFSHDNLIEVQDIIKKVLKKPSTFNEPFHKTQHGKKITLVLGRIEELEGRYLTPDEQTLLESELKSNGYKVKDIS